MQTNSPQALRSREKVLEKLVTELEEGRDGLLEELLKVRERLRTTTRESIKSGKTR